MSESQERLLIDRIRKELHKVTDEELARVTDAEQVLKALPERTRERLKGIIDSYRDLEVTVRKLAQLTILGLTSDTAKVASFNTDDNQWPTGMMNYGDHLEACVSVGSRDPFYTYPTGNKFRLELGKKYRLLVAFIPEEEKKA